MRLRVQLFSAIAGAALALSASSVPVPFFVDGTEASGLIFHHQNSKTSRKYLPETMAGGVAVLDVDSDGWMDVFFVNGAKLTVPHPDGEEPKKSAPKFWNRLFRNNADGTFSDVTVEYGVEGRGYGMGVAAGDYDNDGDADLLVANFGTGDHPSSILYRNESGKKFVDVTERSGIETQGWTTSAGFVDYDHDGDLDLFVCRFVKWSFGVDHDCRLDTSAGRAAGRSYCHPDAFEPNSNYLFRNNGDGTFTDVSASAGIQSANGKGLGVVFGDINDDGRIDISVANDSVPQFLFQNQGDGSFSEIAMDAGVALDEDGQNFGGMGTDLGDLNGDGLPEILTTTISLQRYAYYLNLGDSLFDYETVRSTLGVITHPYTGWGMKFFDFDNDGHRDVFLANGHVMDNIGQADPSLQYLQPPLLLRYSNGRFTDVSKQAGPTFQRPWASRGAAVGDFDNDGYLDIVVTNCGGPAYLAKNQTDRRSKHNWLGVKLRGCLSNRDGIGAKIVVTTPDGNKQYATASRTASYLSSQDPRVFFGLGEHTEIPPLLVHWPSGTEQTVPVDEVNRIIVVEEPGESCGKT